VASEVVALSGRRVLITVKCDMVISVIMRLMHVYHRREVVVVSRPLHT